MVFRTVNETESKHLLKGCCEKQMKNAFKAIIISDKSPKEDYY